MCSGGLADTLSLEEEMFDLLRNTVLSWLFLFDHSIFHQIPQPYFHFDWSNTKIKVFWFIVTVIKMIRISLTYFEFELLFLVITFIVSWTSTCEYVTWISPARKSPKCFVKTIEENIWRFIRPRNFLISKASCRYWLIFWLNLSSHDTLGARQSWNLW